MFTVSYTYHLFIFLAGIIALSSGFLATTGPSAGFSVYLLKMNPIYIILWKAKVPSIHCYSIVVGLLQDSLLVGIS